LPAFATDAANCLASRIDSSRHSSSSVRESALALLHAGSIDDRGAVLKEVVSRSPEQHVDRQRQACLTLDAIKRRQLTWGRHTNIAPALDRLLDS
jgi:hypothetical protein